MPNTETKTGGCSTHGPIVVCGHTDATCPNKAFEVTATESRLETFKHSYNIADVKLAQQAFFSFEEMRKKDKAQYILGADNWYQFTLSGSFSNDTVPDDIKQTQEAMKMEPLPDKQKYAELMLNFYLNWKNNVLKDKAKTIKARPYIKAFLDILEKLPDPTTMDELRDLYRKQANLNELSAVAYQEGLPEEKGMRSNPFVHFRSDRKSGYQHEKPSTEIRLYLNPPAAALPELARRFSAIAEKRNVPYYFKMIDFSLQRPTVEEKTRQDRMLFYTDKATAPTIIQILNEVRAEHPEWFAGRSLPPLVAHAGEGIGIAEEPSEYQKKKFGESGKSFNSVRGKLLYDVWQAVMRDIIVKHPELIPRGGRTMKQIFIDHFPSDKKSYSTQALQSNLDEKLLDSKGQRALEEAVCRTLAGVIPFIKPESLLPGIKIHLQRKAKEYGVDPDNIAFNLSETH